jgi:hypothetical protein
MPLSDNTFDYPGFDYAAQRTKIARKLALSKALQDQGLQTLPTDRQVGGWAIPISPFEGLAKLAQTYAGAKIGQSVYGDQESLAKEAQGKSRAALSQALGTSGLDQKEIDAYTSALMDPLAYQAAPFLASGMVQKRQMAMIPALIAEIRKQQGGVQSQPINGPQPGEGQGYGVLEPGTTSQAPSAPTQAGGLPVGGLESIIGGTIGNPGITKLGEMMHSDAQTRGGVQYDQNGQAFIINNNGQRVNIPGTMARDKPEAVDTGGTTQFVDPYKQSSPIPKTLTPMQQIQAPLERGRYQWETGQPIPQTGALPTPNQGPIPQQAQSVPIPRGTTPMPGVTPKAAAEIAHARAAAKPEATAALGDATNNFDRLAKEVKGIMDDPALSRITGIYGKIPNVPGSAATNVAARLEAVKSQVAFAVLQAMRNMSKTGGALGQVSNFEEQMLQNNLAAITDRNQSPESMKANLQKILDYTEAAKGRLSKAYQDTYQTDPNSGAIVRPSTNSAPLRWEELK